MNRINMIINKHATNSAMCFYHAGVFARGGYIEQAVKMTDRMKESDKQLLMWVGISQAIRGWQL